MKTRSALRSPRRLLPALLVALAACQSPGAESPAAPAAQGQQARVSSEFEATAEVVSIDPAERRVTLRREDGSMFDVRLGEAVRNFAQIAVGDVVRVTYQETLAAARLPAGTDIRPSESAFAAARARPGEKPGAGLGAALSIRVRVESIDLGHDIVVFSLASGELIARRLRTQEGRTFVRGLQVGDLVELAYAESLAIEVQEL
jgi:hypothetical protein